MSRIINVCVIGAGAAGLCALRHLTALPSKFSVVAYEQAMVAGGTWVYNEQTGSDDDGLPIHSSMYRNLRTNLPKEVMSFPDFAFDKNLPSFISHQQVRKYLDDYADNFDVRKYIEFGTIVDHVEPYTDSASGKTLWTVRVKPVKKEENSVSTERQFDAVVVCNGHYSVPLIPEITGLETFTGHSIHSHNYRHPEPYKDQTVLVLGAASSGTDIALDISPFAKQVYLSHNRAPLKSVLPPNVSQTKGIQHINSDKITLSDNTILTADTILFCTGYHFKFPFFSDNTKIVSIDKDEIVSPLYKHLFHIKYPSLSFIGIPKKICPFPLFDCQIRLVSAMLSDNIQLPTESEMLADMDKEFKNRLGEGLPARYAHTMGDKQWPYNDDLADIGQFEKIPRVVQTLYEAVHAHRVSDLTAYKSKKYELIDSEHFSEVKS